MCACGYTTTGISNWYQHSKRCKLVPNEKDARIATLEKQLADKDEQIKAQSDEIKSQREDIRLLERLVAERCAELKEEVKLLRKRKQPPARVHRTEPQRRMIAKRQNWICAGKECTLEGQELQEYDIDHIIPLSLGGGEEDDNLQALCPACHRKKTDQERLGSCRDQNEIHKQTSEIGGPIDDR